MLSRKRAVKTRIALTLVAVAGVIITWFLGLPASAQEHMGAAMPATTGAAPAAAHHGGEAALVVPNLGDTSVASFLGGTPGSTLLYGGIGVCVVGMIFAFMIYKNLESAPVHKSMLEVSELIYETCKTYLVTQIKFIMILELFIGSIIAFYFGVLQHMSALKVSVILLFSLVGIAGSYGVAWFGIRVNTFANSRTAFASLRGKPFPCYAIPLKAGIVLRLPGMTPFGAARRCVERERAEHGRHVHRAVVHDW